MSVTLLHSIPPRRMRPIPVGRRPPAKIGKANRRRLALGHQLREIRRAKGWTLGDVSTMTGLAVSTLSKVERGQISLTYDNLAKLADGLRIDAGAFFAPELLRPTLGRRSITRRNKGRAVEGGPYLHRHLATELSSKAMSGSVSLVKARTLEAFGPFERYDGERLIYVLAGAVTFHSEHYEPVMLTEGDSLYVDGTMAHAVLAVGDGTAQILSIVSATARIAAVERRHAA